MRFVGVLVSVFLSADSAFAATVSPELFDDFVLTSRMIAELTDMPLENLKCVNQREMGWCDFKEPDKRGDLHIRTISVLDTPLFDYMQDKACTGVGKAISESNGLKFKKAIVSDRAYWGARVLVCDTTYRK